MQCSICLDPPSMPLTTPCDHVFCSSCLYEWISKSKDCRCPMCRDIIHRLPAEQTICHVRIPPFPAGVTVTNEISTGKVIVININKRDSAYCNGLRRGQIIRKINNIPIFTHEQCIGIIEACLRKRECVHCEIERKSCLNIQGILRPRVPYDSN